MPRLFSPKFSTPEEAIEYGYDPDITVDEFNKKFHSTLPPFPKEKKDYLSKLNPEDYNSIYKAKKLFKDKKISLKELNDFQALYDYEQWLLR